MPKIKSHVVCDDIVRKEKVSRAVTLLERVLNSNNFEQDVNSFSFMYKRCVGYLWWKKCEEILINGFYDTDDSRDIVLKNLRQEEIFLRICVVNRNHRKVIGYTYPNDATIYIYRNWVDIMDEAGLCGNFMHEYSHNVGYQHDFYYDELRQYSVPYAVGEIAESIARELK